MLFAKLIIYDFPFLAFLNREIFKMAEKPFHIADATRDDLSLPGIGNERARVFCQNEQN